MIGTDRASLVDNKWTCEAAPAGGVVALSKLAPPGRAVDRRICGRTERVDEVEGERCRVVVAVREGGGDKLGRDVVMVGAGRRERWRGVVDWRRAATGGMSM